MPEKPNCYKCKYREKLMGDTHSKCVHPTFADLSKNPLFEFLSVLGKQTDPAQIFSSECFVVGNPHGIRMGWFNHPFNFDPVWLVSCTGFVEKTDG